MGVPLANRRGLQRSALGGQQQHHSGADRRRPEQRAAPAEGSGHGDAVSRRRCVAQVAGDAVPAESVAQTRLVHPRVQDRKIHRVEYAVAQAAHHRGRDQHRKVLRQARHQRAGHREREPAE